MNRAGTATVLRLGYFSMSPALELARARGLFAEHGLIVEAEPVTSSPAQFRALAAGDHDLVLTSPDNVAAYRFGADNPLGEQLDVRIVLAVDGGLGLSLLAANGIRRPDDLRGATIGVDVPDSGFAFALYELLADHGLRRGIDYEPVALGSTPRRAVALREGRCAATLLNGGFAISAERAGLANLGRISDVVDPYLATVLAGTDSWLDGHPGVVRQFRAAWQEAVDLLLGPGSGQDLAPLLADVFGLPAAQLPAMRRLLADPAEGLVPDGVVDEDALANVFELRARHGPTATVAAMRTALAGDGLAGIHPASASPSDERHQTAEEAGPAIRLTVNGTDHEVHCDPDTPLLYVLRNDLGLTAAKFGCGLGLCGACNVLVDGRPVHSCDTPVWSCVGKNVRTLEGLGDAEHPHPMQRAVIAEQAMQCGYCISGMIVSAAALLDSDAELDEAAVRRALEGNLCRCGAHNRIVRAVLAASAAS
jgi:nicotinate dehydrogenase subunit A